MGLFPSGNIHLSVDAAADYTRYYCRIPLYADHFVLKDYPELSVKEAMAKSSELMAGNKLRIFGYALVFSLIVSCLGILTLGIGYIWLIPWANSFFVHFYLSVLREKGEPIACEVLT